MMSYLKSMAKTGKKFPLNEPHKKGAADFGLFYNEFVSTNDSLLIAALEEKFLFTSFGSPDFLSTRNRRFCQHLEQWFQTITSRSTSISTYSERKREWFFRQLEKKVTNTREKIEVLYDY